MGVAWPALRGCEARCIEALGEGRVVTSSPPGGWQSLAAAPPHPPWAPWTHGWSSRARPGPADAWHVLNMIFLFSFWEGTTALPSHCTAPAVLAATSQPAGLHRGRAAPRPPVNISGCAAACPVPGALEGGTPLAQATRALSRGQPGGMGAGPPWGEPGRVGSNLRYQHPLFAVEREPPGSAELWLPQGKQSFAPA